MLWWMLGTDKTQVVKFVTVWRHGLESDIIIIPSEILGVRSSDLEHVILLYLSESVGCVAQDYLLPGVMVSNCRSSVRTGTAFRRQNIQYRHLLGFSLRG